MFYKKKPVMVEAYQFDGTEKDRDDLIHWINTFQRINGRQLAFAAFDGITIPTLEGVHRVIPGDWIIKGVEQEFYPCKPNIFSATYEPAE